VDSLDYDFWKSHFGNVLSGAGAGSAAAATTAAEEPAISVAVVEPISIHSAVQRSVVPPIQRAAVATVRDNALLLWSTAPANVRSSQSDPSSHALSGSIASDERGDDSADDVFASLAIGL